jgi:hypothetical protein
VKPDFSGEWILNRPASTLDAGAAAIETGTVWIDHRKPSFRFRTTMWAGGRSLKYGYESISDGKEVAREGSIDSLRWDGEALVFTGRSQSADGLRTMSFRYELLDGGRRFRAVEQIRCAGRDQDNICIFERRERKMATP